MERGYATLADGTAFQSAVGDLMRMAEWIGTEVQVDLNPGPNLVFPYRLTNVATGEFVVGKLLPI
jgi:hypothetical protein